MSRKQEANDYDGFREVAEERCYLDAWEFRQWLVSHYRGAENPAECLAALVAALYGRLGRTCLDYDIEPEDLAAMFDDAIRDVDEAGAHHALIHVTEMGAVGGIDMHIATGASAGARMVPWAAYVAGAAADDAKDALAEKHNPPAGHPAVGLKVEP